MTTVKMGLQRWDVQRMTATGCATRTPVASHKIIWLQHMTRLKNSSAHQSKTLQYMMYLMSAFNCWINKS